MFLVSHQTYASQEWQAIPFCLFSEILTGTFLADRERLNEILAELINWGYKKAGSRPLTIYTDIRLFLCRCIYMLSISVYIYIYMFWEVCVRLDLAPKWRAISCLWIADAVLSTLVKTYFSQRRQNLKLASVLSKAAAAYCAYSADGSDGWSRGLWFGELFSFYSWHKVFGRMENASPITALALEVGNGQCGYSWLMQMQNRPGSNKTLFPRGLIWYLATLVLELKFSLTFSHDDTVLLHCYLLAFVV